MVFSNRTLLRRLVSFFFVSAAVSCAALLGFSICADDATPALTTVEGYMSRIGGKLEFYYTIEYATRTANVVSPFEIAQYQEDSRDILTVNELAVHLQKTLKNIVVLKDQFHPNVLHLVDEQARREARYPIENCLTIRFSGVLADLPDAIGACVPKLKTRRSGDWRRSDNDVVTKVDLAVWMPRTVREILTDAVPEPYHKRPSRRLIWESMPDGAPDSGNFVIRYPFPVYTDDFGSSQTREESQVK